MPIDSYKHGKSFRSIFNFGADSLRGEKTF